MKVYQAAVIGAGSIAHVHLRAMQANPRVRITAVADVNEERVQAVAAAYDTRPYTDYRRMVEQTKPDFVLITLPHFLHKEAAVWCADQGCHVLLEKPMALNEEECAEINEAARRNRITLAVGHIQHYFPENIRAREIIRSGKLGKLVGIHDRRYAYYFGANRPRWTLDKAMAGGGIAFNLGAHSIDKAQWLTDSLVTQVKADLTYHGAVGDVEGSAALYLSTASGVPVTVALNGYAGVPLNETDLLFTEGQLKIVARRSLWISKDNAFEQIELKLEEQPEPFAAQLEGFLDTVEFGTESSITGEYGLAVSAVIDAVYRSHETGTLRHVNHKFGGNPQ